MSRPLKITVTFVLRALIRAYQLCLAPLIGPVCRFTPSCSVYAAEAISVHGPLRGAVLSVSRLCRCHPWGGSGHDPVPGPVPGPIPSRLQCTSAEPTSLHPTS